MAEATTGFRNMTFRIGSSNPQPPKDLLLEYEAGIDELRRRIIANPAGFWESQLALPFEQTIIDGYLHLAQALLKYAKGEDLVLFTLGTRES